MFPEPCSGRHMDWTTPEGTNAASLPHLAEGPSDRSLPAAALGAVHNAVFITRVDGTITWVNQAFVRMSGHAASDVLGRTPQVLNSGIQDGAHYRAMWSTILEGRGWRGELVNRHRDGHHYRVIQTITPIQNGAGEVTHFVAVHEDVTELRRSQARLQAIFDHTTDAMALIDDQGQLVAGNPAVCTLTGHTEAALQAMVLQDLIPDRGQERFTREWHAFIASGQARGILPLLRADGQVAEVEFEAVRDVVDGLHLLVGKDVTERRRADAQLRAQAQILQRRAAQQAGIAALGQWAFDAPDACSVAARAGEIVEDVLGVRAAVHRGDGPDAADQQVDALRIGFGSGCELVVFDPGRIELEDRQFLRAVAHVVESAVHREDAQAQLRALATHDTLTGLPNRTLFLDRLDLVRADAGRTGRDFAVIYLDLDGFKFLNEGIGTALGDDLLRSVAERLSGVLRPGDTVARFGGDEFAMLCAGVDAQRSGVIAQRIQSELAAGFVVGDTTLTVTASIGIAIGTGQSDSADLLRDADAAMYEAKHGGRNRIEVFEPRMTEQARHHYDTTSALHRALLGGGVTVRYQPTIDLATGRIVGVEALARLQRDDGTLIPPSDFIWVAEQAGLMEALGAQVLEQACQDAAPWVEEDPGFQLAVNVSPTQLTGTGLVDTVVSTLDSAGVLPASVWVEVTESALVAGPAALATMDELRDHGLRFAIDDFGTGYSSLAHLQRMPVDMLKIDRSFVRDLLDDKRDRALVVAAVDVARAFGLVVTAEGVETSAQADVLRSLDVELAQGYLWSPPVDATTISELLAAQACP
jgi:diguanylate cyclase (GGDEF)-like protein/PAS domain S-box-containing protein